MNGKKTAFLLSGALLACMLISARPLFAEGSQQQSPGVSSPDINQLMGDVESAFNQMDEAEAPGAGMSPEDEYYLGRAVAAEIIKTYGLYTAAPALTDYLNKICFAVTINSPRPTLFSGYYVEILDTDEICAFATPGGHIFISRGFIAAASSEDALAALIAHETAHIQLRHAAAIIENERTVRDLTASIDRAASIAARSLTDEERAVLFRESVTVSVNTLFRDGYSQEQEFEADRTAVSLLRSAGYDPAALGELLETLLRDPRPGSLDRTHPSPSLRIMSLGDAGTGMGRDTLPARKARYEEALKELR